MRIVLTADQIRFYQNNGYLLLEQVISSNMLTSLRETVDRFIEAWRAVKSSNRILAVGVLIDNCTDEYGPLTIHHVRTLHASGNSSINTLRPLLLFSYTAVDAFPIVSSYGIQECDSKILHGLPVHKGRMMAPPFRIHLLQKSGTDSIYDNQASIQS